MNPSFFIVCGAVSIPVIFGVIALVHHFMFVEVKERQSVILTSFGQWMKQWDQPGEYFVPTHIFPWVKTISVSTQTRSLLLDQISIHDRDGTSLLAALFIEYAIVDPKKALFSVENWRDSMQSLCLHTTTSSLSGLQFDVILKNRSVLEQTIQTGIKNDLERWGISLRRVLIQNLSLLPEVNRQVLQGVASHLEKKKALIEETARMEALKIEAETQYQTAALKGEAQSQMALAIGRAMEALKNSPPSFEAYQKLYTLSLSKPERTVVFKGFDENLDAADASFILGGDLEQMQRKTASNAATWD